ncbi:MAG: arsenosugar biosynthesis radical SAM (seleno)protein ArsS [Salibacteraceae bacterium]
MGLIKSLKARSSSLSYPKNQIDFLSNGLFKKGELPRFKDRLESIGNLPLKPTEIEVLQINLGYMCNQTCAHCHVDAGPDRKEIMTQSTMQDCLKVLRENSIHTLDLTGGAPEMNPHFRWFVEQAKPFVNEIIVRSNLTIILANRKHHDLPEFFAKNSLRVISSLPFYNADKTDRQRGKGVFSKSIDAIKRLNQIGYGNQETGLTLDLVYNPTGAFLPAAQASLEADFKRVLKKEFDLVFNQLFCITNLPISRFLEYLIKTDNYEDYMDKLVEAFNPDAVDGLMCRNTISVGWQGSLYDCDFNQMLELKTGGKAPKHIKDFDREALNNRTIVTNQHCYGCTAGAGSSCQGTLV